MKKLFLLPLILFFFFSCRMQSNSDKESANPKESKLYRLRLNPEAGSKYYFDISNESEIKLELNDKKTDNLSRTNVGILYAINKDSAGDFLFNMSYGKIKLYSKKDDIESEMDAGNAASSLDPAEKMLGALKTANIVATIGPDGEVRSVTGYKEIAAKLMAGLNSNDMYAKNLARDRVEKLIGEGVVKKNMTQLFKIFPDSGVHVGDQWKLESKQNAELNLVAKNIFILKEVKNDLAMIESEADMFSDSTSSNMMGYDVTANLKGRQRGTYTMNIKTGMLENCELNGNVDGTLQMMGREIPVTIKTKVKIKGRKEN